MENLIRPTELKILFKDSIKLNELPFSFLELKKLIKMLFLISSEEFILYKICYIDLELDYIDLTNEKDFLFMEKYIYFHSICPVKLILKEINHDQIKQEKQEIKIVEVSNNLESKTKLFKHSSNIFNKNLDISHEDNKNEEIKIDSKTEVCSDKKLKSKIKKNKLSKIKDKILKIPKEIVKIETQNVEFKSDTLPIKLKENSFKKKIKKGIKKDNKIIRIKNYSLELKKEIKENTECIIEIEEDIKEDKDDLVCKSKKNVKVADNYLLKKRSPMISKIKKNIEQSGKFSQWFKNSYQKLREIRQFTKNNFKYNFNLRGKNTVMVRFYIGFKNKSITKNISFSEEGIDYHWDDEIAELKIFNFIFLVVDNFAYNAGQNNFDYFNSQVLLKEY